MHPWQTANVFVLFNAFEMFCFPQCITDMTQVYFFICKMLMNLKVMQIYQFSAARYTDGAQ